MGFEGSKVGRIAFKVRERETENGRTEPMGSGRNLNEGWARDSAEKDHRDGGNDQWGLRRKRRLKLS